MTTYIHIVLTVITLESLCRRAQRAFTEKALPETLLPPRSHSTTTTGNGRPPFSLQPLCLTVRTTSISPFTLFTMDDVSQGCLGKRRRMAGGVRRGDNAARRAGMGLLVDGLRWLTWRPDEARLVVCGWPTIWLLMTAAGYR